MKKLSETAAFVRLMQLSRHEFLRAQSGYQACKGEPHDALLPCEIAAEKESIHAPQGTKDASDKESEGNEVLAHGSGLGFDVEAQNALVAAGLRLEAAGSQPLNLELAFGGRVLTPSAYTALVNAERGCDGGLGAVVADNIRGLHGA